MLHSFPPIIASHPKILILGSMPSVSSLEKQEYYGFTHNRFWKIIASYFKLDFHEYAQKVNCIEEHNIILWDVIAYCEREGSLDSKIKNEVCNDIEAIVNKYPSIEVVLCNGRKSYDLYQRHMKQVKLPCHLMPSTSNANRSINEQELFAQWFYQFDQVFK